MKEEPAAPRDLNVDPELVRMIVAKSRAAMFHMPDAEEDMPDTELELDGATSITTEDTGHLSDEAMPDQFRTEAAAMIDSLNVDEQAEIVALVLVGRGDYDITEFTRAVQEVKHTATGPASGRLFEIDIFPSHLANGLDAWETWRSQEP